ncbi:putative trehalose synthase [Pseudomonas aeruginosa]|nr:putative trehalose synthase [Pseudomonas aeruginosa]
MIAHGDGEIQFIPAADWRKWTTSPDEDVLPFSVEQSNSSIRFGERMVLKVLRKILPGCTRKSRSAAT